MEKSQLAARRDQLRSELFSSVLPFWTEHMRDEQNGGIFSCLDEDGSVYSSDKPLWVEGRCLWVFSRLCSVYGARAEWLDIAASCREFLDAHGFDQCGRMYYWVTADGRPLRKRRYYFSETFYAIGCAEYALVTGDERALARAREVYDLACRLCRDPASDPYRMPPKFEPATRPTRAFAAPMILLNVSAVLRRCDPANRALYESRAAEFCEDILSNFYHPELGAVLEVAGMGGEFIPESSLTRVINPGHGLEAVWFLLDAARYLNRPDIRAGALGIFDCTIERGWDNEYGGIVHFADAFDKPALELEADMKLWWPHNEAIIAALRCWEETGDEKYAAWFNRLTDYALGALPDRANGEWYGYLHRDGGVGRRYKGNMFKGPFHIPRMLMELDEILTRIIGG